MRRLRVVARHLISPRGLLIGGAAVTAIAGLIVPEQPARNILLVTSGLAITTVLLLMSLRLSELHARTGRLENSRNPPPMNEATKSAAIVERAAAGPAPAAKMASRPDSPLITVVVPNYNHAPLVGEAIGSVLAQTFSDWECIVIDDASTDGSLQAIWEASHGDPRIRPLRHRVNGGLSASRNTGLRLARGRFVAFLDADDLLLPKSMEDRLEALTARLDDPYVLGSYTGVAYRQGVVPLNDLPTSISWPDEERKLVDFVTSEGECPFPVMAPLCLTKVVRQLGGFDESMRDGAEDWDLWQRALRNGYVFVPGTAKTAVYRQRPGSMVRQGSSPHARLGIALIDASHAEVEPGLVNTPTPTPLPRPLSWYTKSLTQSRRAVRFGTVAWANGDHEEAEGLMATVEELPLALVERHVDIDDETRRGLTRAGETTSDEVIAAAAAWARSRFANEKQDAVEAGPRIPLLLVPQHADHLVAMLRHAANAYPGAVCQVLILEREGATQGVMEKMPPDVVSYTLNRWVLAGLVAEVALVGEVRSAVVEEVALDLAAAGADVIEIPDDYVELKSIPEALDRSAGGDGLQAATSPQNGSSRSVVERWPAEEDPATRVDFDRIRDLKDIHLGERVVIIGNGPSLNQLDLTLLKAERTFGVNGIFYAAEQMGFAPTYYVVEDSAVVDDNLEAIRAYEADSKLFPSIYREKIGEIDGASFFMMNRSFYAPDSPNFCVPNFATDCTQQIFCGQSVTIINLQLAYHMGFSEVILIGMDFSYTIPDDAKQTGYQILSEGPDPNHFHPDYFGKGKVWKQPKLDRVLACYALAKQVYEADGRRIVNSTAGGQLHLFERVPYEEVLR